jgi:hypothetical protein
VGEYATVFGIVLIETVMRVAGAILLVSGFLLCTSVAWAAIGFFAMGFGLIFLLIAKERKKVCVTFARLLYSAGSDIAVATKGLPVVARPGSARRSS